MAKGKNEKVGKDFVKQYGKETVFSYGCEPGTSDIYVYRMTMTNEDGDVVEYSPDFMRYRCEQMGVKCVPVFAKATIDVKESTFMHLIINYMVLFMKRIMPVILLNWSQRSITMDPTPSVRLISAKA